MAPLPEDTLHDIQHLTIGKDVDPDALGLLLSEDLITRLNGFRPTLRRRVLRSARKRLLEEGGEYRAFCTGMWGT